MGQGTRGSSAGRGETADARVVVVCEHRVLQTGVNDENTFLHGVQRALPYCLELI